MKQYITVWLIVFSLVGHSQTKEIAHKSHGGSSKTFKAGNYLDNLGLPSPDHIDEVRKIDDSTVVIYSVYTVNYKTQEKKDYPLDTIRDKSCIHNPKRYLDSMTYRNMHVILSKKANYVGFKKSELKKSTYKLELKKKMINPYRKSKGSMGMYIFCIVVIGLLLMVRKKMLSIICLCIISTTGFTQTKEIAHKSHSGSSKTFNPSSYLDNLGEGAPMPVLVKVKRYKTNDLIEFYTMSFSSKTYQDTIYNVGNEERVLLRLDSLAANYTMMHSTIELKGFNAKTWKRPDHVKLKKIQEAQRKSREKYTFSMRSTKLVYASKEAVTVQINNKDLKNNKVYTDGNCDVSPVIMLLPNNDSIINAHYFLQMDCGLPFTELKSGTYTPSLYYTKESEVKSWVVVMDLDGKGRVRSNSFKIE